MSEWTAIPGWFRLASVRASRSNRCLSLITFKELLRQHLYRDVTAEPRVFRPVDLSHPARPEGREDLVRAELRSGGERHALDRF